MCVRRGCECALAYSNAHAVDSSWGCWAVRAQKVKAKHTRPTSTSCESALALCLSAVADNRVRDTVMCVESMPTPACQKTLMCQSRRAPHMTHSLPRIATTTSSTSTSVLASAP